MVIMCWIYDDAWTSSFYSTSLHFHLHSPHPLHYPLLLAFHSTNPPPRSTKLSHLWGTKIYQDASCCSGASPLLLPMLGPPACPISLPLKAPFGPFLPPLTLILKHGCVWIGLPFQSQPGKVVGTSISPRVRFRVMTKVMMDQEESDHSWRPLKDSMNFISALSRVPSCMNRCA